MPAGAIVAALVVTSLSGARQEQALKDLLPEGMLIGAALNQRQIEETDDPAVSIVRRHFNTITSENVLKWESVHPDARRFTFAASDRYVAFGVKHGMAVIGHTLVWHHQTPEWVFASPDGAPLDRDTLIARMRTHIQTVVGRYKGRVRGWDVVNEALNDDGSLRRTPWLEIIGDDYIAKAFEFAHAADPDAELYYNDYGLARTEKRAAALRIVQDLRRRGLRIDGVGEQAHWALDGPSPADIEQTILDIADAGVDVMLTEMDVTVLAGVDGDIYARGLPDEQQARLSRRYRDIFDVIGKHRDKIARVTFWGVSDADSWLNDFPIQGRTDYPLLWDRQRRPKPAFHAVIDALQR